MVCLLIDVGSTFIKYSIYNKKTKATLLSEKITFPLPELNENDRFIVSLSKINKIIDCVFDRTKTYGYKKAFICVQMHGFVLRKADGSFSDYVSWRDNSGNISDNRLSEIDFNQMGTSLKRNLPLVKLAFKNRKEEFFTLGSYIAWYLTGNNATHITDACASGFFFADTGAKNQYAEDLKMPHVYMQVSPTGSYNGVCIYSPIGDHQASFLGGVSDQDKYLLNIGTATQISCVHDASYPNGEYEKRPFGESKRLYTVSGLMGGDKIFAEKDYQALLEQVNRAISALPPKKEIVLGGGGSNQVYDFLFQALERKGLRCSLAEQNIGIGGLKKIADEIEL